MNNVDKFMHIVQKDADLRHIINVDPTVILKDQADEKKILPAFLDKLKSIPTVETLETIRHSIAVLERRVHQREQNIKIYAKKLSELNSRRAAVAAVQQKWARRGNELRELRDRLRYIKQSKNTWRNLQDDTGMKDLVGSIQTIFNAQVGIHNQHIRLDIESDQAAAQLAEADKVLDAHEKQRRDEVGPKLQKVERTTQCLEKRESHKSALRPLQNRVQIVNDFNAVSPLSQSDNTMQQSINSLRTDLHIQRMYLDQPMALDPASRDRPGLATSRERRT